MTTMDQIHRIRELYYEQDKNLNEIAIIIGRLTHHVELILFPGINNRLRESSINATLSKISSQETGNNGKK